MLVLDFRRCVRRRLSPLFKLFSVEINGAMICQYNSNHAGGGVRKKYVRIFKERTMDTTTVSRPTDGFVVTISLQSEEDPGMPPEGSQLVSGTWNSIL